MEKAVKIQHLADAPNSCAFYKAVNAMYLPDKKRARDDDAVILSYTAEKTQRMIDVFVEANRYPGMEFGHVKNKLLNMSFDAPVAFHTTIKIAGNAIESVKS